MLPFGSGKYTQIYNSNRNIKQNIGGDGDGPQNNTSRHFQKRAGGLKKKKKKKKVKRW